MNSIKPIVNVRHLGRIGYNKALQIQEACIKAINDAAKEQVKPNNTLLLLEHQPVYTVGIRSKLYSKEEENKLKALGADFVRTNRGGLITFHGPGQLVAYPILYLGDFNARRSIKWYVENLEKTIINMSNAFDIKATTSPYTGVWVGNDKIAAIGIHRDRNVTSHGVAINCDIDLTWFSHIVPCGIPDRGVTSLSRLLGRTVTVSEALPPFLGAFQDHFNCHLAGWSPDRVSFQCGNTP
ncbi:LIPT2 [Cordylochernes scorpioides]|uniref:Octanoyl-[acyl-carrier-protein]:protein N-octanoyltransferase LIPT2, mitochondrial n=1 Tax=Cordylochernes scorpioides TaxID=51811 RepID=A0ABY6K0C4_9ARAC|nr:LIPT2 [Cordylochernes scorpioides]